MRGRAQLGFSLIEIVVTMAVLGLILFAAVPSIGAWMDNTRIRNMADSLQNGLQTARGEAVRRNQDMSFWLVGLEDPGVLANTAAASTPHTIGGLRSRRTPQSPRAPCCSCTAWGARSPAGPRSHKR